MEKIETLMAMALIAALEALAIYYKIDGSLLALSIGAIAGLGGYKLGKRSNKEEEEETE